MFYSDCVVLLRSAKKIKILLIWKKKIRFGFLGFFSHSVSLLIVIFQVSQKHQRFHKGLMTFILPIFSKLFDSY